MFRGFCDFVCDDCGHRFKGMDCEWMATAYTAPVKCPKCGGWHTYPPGFLGLNKYFYLCNWLINNNLYHFNTYF